MDNEKVRRLIELRKTRLLQAALAGLPKELFKTRLKGLIYFHAINFGGWRRRKRGPNGEMLEERLQEGGIFEEERLGYPSRHQIQRAIHFVHSTCPEESRQYEAAFKRFKECRRRFLAAGTSKAYEAYRHKIRYYEYIEIFRGPSESATFGPGGYYLYRDRELYPRWKEKRRAESQIKAIQREMEQWRNRIFDKLKVPEAFRALI